VVIGFGAGRLRAIPFFCWADAAFANRFVRDQEVNCAALLPPSLMNPINLFRVAEKGAFTGDWRGQDRARFSRRRHQTIFPDAIGELPLLELQPGSLFAAYSAKVNLKRFGRRISPNDQGDIRPPRALAFACDPRPGWRALQAGLVKDFWKADCREDDWSPAGMSIPGRISIFSTALSRAS